MEAGRLSREIFIGKKEEEEREDGGSNNTNPPPLLPTYMPHLSLLYSDIEEEERGRIAEEYEKLLSQEQQENEGAVLNRGFVVDRLSVWETPAEDKTLKSWQMIEEIPLYWQ
jgi:hypothetical protein